MYPPRADNAIFARTLLPALQHPALPQLPKQLRLQELANRDVLRKPLPPSSLEHKVARRRLCRRGLERPQLDFLVERVAGDDGPAVEDEGEGDLALGVDLREISIIAWIVNEAREGYGLGKVREESKLTRRSVSKPKESMTGIKPRTLYSGVPAMGPSCST